MSLICTCLSKRHGRGWGGGKLEEVGIVGGIDSMGLGQSSVGHYSLFVHRGCGRL